MVRKTPVKKQLVSRHEKLLDAVNIPLEVFQSSLTLWTDFLHSLSTLSTSAEQAQALQSSKKKFRQVILDIALDFEQRSNLVQDFLLLYSHPRFFPFHVVVEWIVSFLQERNNDWTTEKIQQTVISVAKRIWTEFIIEFSNCSDQKIVEQWIMTFNTFVALDRIFNWIPDHTSQYIVDLIDSGIDRLSVISVHRDFLRVLLRTKDLAENERFLVAKDNIRFVAVVSDVFRNLATLLKPFLTANIQVLFQEKNQYDLFSELCDMSSDFFTSAEDFEHKDLVANLGQLLVIQALLLSTINNHREVCYESHRSLRTILDVVTVFGSDQGSLNSETRQLTKDWTTAPIILKSALIRGIISTVEQDKLNVSLLLHEGLRDFLISRSLQGDTNSQLFQLQTLLLWITRLKAVISSQSSSIGEEGDVLEHLSTSLWPLISSGWTHPNRLVTHLVPDLFRSLVSIMVQRCGEERRQNYLKTCLMDISTMPPNHRSRYEALAIVLDNLSAEEVFRFRPSLLQELLNSMEDRNISSSVATLWIDISSKVSPDDSQHVDVLQRLLCSGLSSSQRLIRSNISDYLLPEICSRLPSIFSPLKLLVSLQQRGDLDRSEPAVPVLWMIVQLLWRCKLTVQATDYESLERDSTLQSLKSRVLSMLAIAAVHEDADLRLTALLAISASHKSTSPLFPTEVATMKDSLIYSLRTSDTDECSKVGKALRQWLMRAKRSAKEGPASFEALLHWLFSVLEEYWLPVSDGYLPADREYPLLLVLSTILEVAQSETPPIGYSPSVASMMLTGGIIEKLLRSLLSNYEKSRKMSLQLLSRLPSPWPGYDSPKTLPRLMVWTISLIESAKSKESLVGAQLLAVIFEKYCCELAYRLTPSPYALVATEPSSPLEAVKSFFGVINAQCSSILVNLSRIFSQVKLSISSSNESAGSSGEESLSAESDFPMAHGYCLSLKYALHVLFSVQPFSPLLSSFHPSARDRPRLRGGVSEAEARGIVSAALSLATSALRSGMELIAHPKDESSQLEGAKGPMGSSVAYSMAASYVNTNSFSLAGEDEGDFAGDNDDAKSNQRAIVAAWLLVKESTGLLAALVSLVPVPKQSGEDLLTVDELIVVGESLLDSLGRLKHMGAIAEAYASLQSVAVSFLSLGDKCPRLSQLPLQWLQRLIERMVNHHQVFILRRSAGFAYSFLAILHAEPYNAQPVLLQYALKQLTDIVEQGISASASDNEDWKFSVHALNVIRLILLDSAFQGKDLDPFIPRIMKSLMLGFSSSVWSIRNSCMMGFSAIVQRMILRKEQKKSSFSSALLTDISSWLDHTTISNVTNLYADNLSPLFQHSSLDSLRETEWKKCRTATVDIGGAMTVKDFFLRFPDLIPLFSSLLSQELSSVSPSVSKENNSLFAVLLFFSKFSVFSSPENDSNRADIASIAGLVQLGIYSHADPSIRTVAAKAFTKVVAISEAPSIVEAKTIELTALTQDLLSRCEEGGSRTLWHKFSEEIHGRLLQLFELWQQFSQFSQLHPSVVDQIALTQSSTVPEAESSTTSDRLHQYHRWFLSQLRNIIDTFFLRFLHPYHSLVMVQLLEAYSSVLEYLTLSQVSQSCLEMWKEIQSLKQGFLVEYLLLTWPYLMSSERAISFPYFPHIVHYFMETLTREMSFSPMPLLRSSRENLRVSWLELVLREEVLAKGIREAKIGVLSGFLSYLSASEDKRDSDQRMAPRRKTERKGEDQLIKSFVQKVTESLLSRSRGADEPVVNLLLLKVLHRYLNQLEGDATNLFSYSQRQRLVNYLWARLFSVDVEDGQSVLLERQAILSALGLRTGTDLPDENRVSYILEIVAKLVFVEESIAISHLPSPSVAAVSLIPDSSDHPVTYGEVVPLERPSEDSKPLEHLPTEVSLEVEAKLRFFLESMTSNSPDWKLFSEKDGLVAKRRTLSTSQSTVCVRAEIQLPFFILEVWRLLTDIHRQCQLDPQRQSHERVKEFSPHTWVDYIRFKGVWPTSPRDFVNLVHWRRLADGSVVIYAFSSPEMETLCPPSAGVVRGEMAVAGYWLRGNTQGTRVHYLVQTDLKGSLGATAIRFVSNSQPLILSNLKHLISEQLRQKQSSDLRGFHSLCEVTTKELQEIAGTSSLHTAVPTTSQSLESEKSERDNSLATERCLTREERIEAKLVAYRVWKETISLAGSKDFNVSIRLSLVRSLQWSSLALLEVLIAAEEERLQRGDKPRALPDSQLYLQRLSLLWRSLLLAMELLQDDDSEIRQETNHLITQLLNRYRHHFQDLPRRDSPDRGDTAEAVRATEGTAVLIESKSLENVDVLFAFLLRQFDHLLTTTASVDHREAVDDALSEIATAFLGCFRKYSPNLSFPTSLLSQRSPQQKIFEAEKPNLFIDVIAFQKTLLDLVFQRLLPVVGSGGGGTPSPLLQRLMSVWILPWAREEWQSMQETQQSLSAQSSLGLDPRVFHWLHLKHRFFSRLFQYRCERDGWGMETDLLLFGDWKAQLQRIQATISEIV